MSQSNSRGNPSHPGRGGEEEEDGLEEAEDTQGEVVTKGEEVIGDTVEHHPLKAVGHQLPVIDKLTWRILLEIHQPTKDEIESQGSINVDYAELREDAALKDVITNIREELRDMPDQILKCLGLAIHQGKLLMVIQDD
ncbi:putative DNA helicase MCM8 isoform X1 [Apostichopus japonicus]|uniref:Putative DNA helicase MCM8 isoform X1 n=1 Tax=Stichopus japonicus TaxID=307972 RepID=A0A2G8L1L2_STIJA|nr:putative DNA helicase MCM8 isoform X1 [Apostichopus japonicus]